MTIVKFNDWSTEQRISFIEMKIKECKETAERVKGLSGWYPYILIDAKQELKEWKQELSLVKNNTDEANRRKEITHWIGYRFGQPPPCKTPERIRGWTQLITMNEKYLTCKKCVKLLRKKKKLKDEQRVLDK